MMKPTDLVLVTVLKDPRDLEIARVLGWYRIPLATAPKTISVDYLAFYQTARFGEEKWAIHYVAPVHGHELTTRVELLRTEPDHPRANERYYKIQIGPLERLARPIPSHGAPAWLCRSTTPSHSSPTEPSSGTAARRSSSCSMAVI